MRIRRGQRGDRVRDVQRSCKDRRGGPLRRACGRSLATYRSQGSLMQVLVVEDDPAIAAPLVGVLERAGFSTTPVSTGREALTTDPGDVVLLDLGLPDMDGLDVCRRLRERSDVPTIVMTARRRGRPRRWAGGRGGRLRRQAVRQARVGGQDPGRPASQRLGTAHRPRRPYRPQRARRAGRGPAQPPRAAAGRRGCNRLKRALRAKIDDEAWATPYRTTSGPFEVPESGRVAVKVINDYGDEVMKVLDVAS